MNYRRNVLNQYYLQYLSVSKVIILIFYILYGEELPLKDESVQIPHYN